MPLDFSCFVRRGNAIVRLYSETSSYSPLCRCRRERAVFGGNLSAVSAQLVIADDEGPTPVLQESSIRRVTSAPPSSPDTMTLRVRGISIGHYPSAFSTTMPGRRRM